MAQTLYRGLERKRSGPCGRLAIDSPPQVWHSSDMAQEQIPTWQLYGERQVFPDVLHIERVADRAEGLDWTIAPHRHLHLHQIFLLNSGHVRMTIGGEIHTPQPPVAINVPRGTVHSFVFSADTDGYVLTLPAANFPDLFNEGAETAAALDQIFFLDLRSVKTRADEILRLHAGNPPFRLTQLRAEAMLLVSTLLALAPMGRQTRLADPRLARFESMVRQSFSDNRRVESFAEDLGLSSRHLSRLCKLQTGLSAQEFVESLKMHEACRLLVYTRMSAQQVAFALGYDDPSYFSRAFKRSLHLSPKDYRSGFDGRGG